MSLDRQLVDRIKEHFARKSSVQLQEVVQSGNHERWSAEAVAAADEVLIDRAAGRAQEPLEVEEEPTPLPLPPIPYSLGFIVGFLPVFAVNGIGGQGFAVDDEVNSDAGEPVPFGPKIAWLAMETTDTAGVATALGLRETREAMWAEGIDAAYQSLIFVTPPLGDWTLAVGIALFPPPQAEAFVKPLLEQLSRQFGDAQYFCTHRVVEQHLWARARRGRLVRGYGWLGEKGLTIWDEGAPTKEEQHLGFRFLDGRSPAAQDGSDEGPTIPDEGCVMQLANLWSIDPMTLNEQFKEPVMGLLGKAAWGEGGTGR